MKTSFIQEATIQHSKYNVSEGGELHSKNNFFIQEIDEQQLDPKRETKTGELDEIEY